MSHNVSISPNQTYTCCCCIRPHLYWRLNNNGGKLKQHVWWGVKRAALLFNHCLNTCNANAAESKAMFRSTKRPSSKTVRVTRIPNTKTQTPTFDVHAWLAVHSQLAHNTGIDGEASTWQKNATWSITYVLEDGVAGVLNMLASLWHICSNPTYWVVTAPTLRNRLHNVLLPGRSLHSPRRYCKRVLLDNYIANGHKTV